MVASLDLLPVFTPTAAGAAVSHSAIVSAWTIELKSQCRAGLLAARTVDTYSRNIQRWITFLDASSVDQPRPADVLAFLAQLRAAKLKAASVNAYLDAVRALYRWAESVGVYPAIARSVRGLPVRKDEPLACLEKGQVVALLALIDGDGVAAARDRALLQVMFSTGLRLVSLVAADISDLNESDGTLSYASKGDVDKVRRAYLSPSALGAVRKYLAARKAENGGRLAQFSPLFLSVGNHGSERLTDRSVRRIITALMERAGHIHRDAGKIVNPRIFSAHSLRRSAITAAYESAGLDAAQTFAAHASPSTTRRAYARIEKGRQLVRLAAALDLTPTP